MSAFHDQEAIDKLSEDIVDALRPLGVTTDAQHGIQIGIQDGQMMIMVIGVVRPDARDRLDRDSEANKEFNKMMAEQNRMMQEEKQQEIGALAENEEALDKWLFDDTDECSHEHVHEGLCLDCHKVVG